MQMTDEPENIAAKRSTPHFAGFPTWGGVDTLFLFVEGQILCEVPSFSRALLLWFITHYVLNLEYVKDVRDVCLFMQEFIFALPIVGSKRVKSGSYLSITTDIQNFSL